MVILVGAALLKASQTLASFVSLHVVTHLISDLGQQLGGWLGLVLGGVVGTAVYRQRVAERRCVQEARLRREATAYLTLDVPPCTIENRQFARLASRTIATCSSFARAALLLRDSSGALTVAGSTGMDDLSVDALNRWAAASGPNVGSCSFTVQLERRAPETGHCCVEELGCAFVHVVPITSSTGVHGAIVVCAGPRAAACAAGKDEQVQRMLEPIEALARRLATEITRETRAAGATPVRASTVRGRERMQNRRRACGVQTDSGRRQMDARTSQERPAPEKVLNLRRSLSVVTKAAPAGLRGVSSHEAEGTSAWAARIVLCSGVGGRLRRQAFE